MSSIPQLAADLHHLFTVVAPELARTTSFSQRTRTLDGAAFVQLLVFGAMNDPSLRYDRLVTLAAERGYVITPQGIADRFSSQSVTLFAQVLDHLLSMLSGADPVAIDLLQEWSAVVIQDSTTIMVPNELAKDWPGRGGSHGAAKAAVTCQVRLDLLRGNLDLFLHPGRRSDRSVSFREPLPKDSIVLRDLGYWRLDTMQHDAAEGRFWVSRVYPNLTIRTREGHLCTLDEVLPRSLVRRVIDRSFWGNRQPFMPGWWRYVFLTNLPRNAVTESRTTSAAKGGRSRRGKSTPVIGCLP